MLSAQVFIFVFALQALHSHCSIPEDISNFQNEYVCDNNIRLVRPLTVADVKESVRRHARVKAVGTVHSWNKFYCAASTSEIAHSHQSSANVAMTTIRPLEIRVNEKDMSVWVSAGVFVADLMVYLGNYVTRAAPRGYALMAVPGFFNQTIAGAVATGTHGSSLKHGSLSNQLLAVKVILANGTLVEISQERHPFFIKSFRLNVGRLGVVTDVKLKIAPETIARRTLRSAVPTEAVMPMLKEAQETYKKAGYLPDWLDATIMSWMPKNDTFEILSYDLPEETQASCDHDDCFTLTEEAASFLEALERSINSPVNVSRSSQHSDIADGVEWEKPTPFPPNLIFSDPSFNFSIEDLVSETIRNSFGNASAETHEVFLTDAEVAQDVSQILVDDYALAIPADKMADCLEAIMSLVVRPTPDNDIRGYLLLRFVGKEHALLSPSNSNPVMHVSAIDYVYYNQQNRSSNVPHKRLLAFVKTSPSCSPVRLHWGKAGWPDPGCWNGAEFYQDSWCDFGCAVMELDPYGKFIGGHPEVWNWEGSNLEKCCTPDGYDTSLGGCGCDVIPIRTPEECPEAPFYTNR